MVFNLVFQIKCFRTPYACSFTLQKSCLNYLKFYSKQYHHTVIWNCTIVFTLLWMFPIWHLQTVPLNVFPKRLVLKREFSLPIASFFLYFQGRFFTPGEPIEAAATAEGMVRMHMHGMKFLYHWPSFRTGHFWNFALRIHNESSTYVRTKI